LANRGLIPIFTLVDKGDRVEYGIASPSWRSALAPRSSRTQRTSATLASGEQDPGVLVFGEGEARKALPRFIAAIARHRHFERELDPPPV
jgi:hypothetical protein